MRKIPFLLILRHEESLQTRLKTRRIEKIRASAWQRQVKRFMGCVAKCVDKLKFEPQSHK